MKNRLAFHHLLLVAPLLASQWISTSIALADSTDNGVSIEKALRALGLTDVTVNGCVVSAALKEPAAGERPSLVIYEQRVDLRTMDFSKLEYVKSSDGTDFIGRVRFNQDYTLEKAKILEYNSVFEQRYGLDWLGALGKVPDQYLIDFENFLDEAGIAFVNFQTYQRPQGKITLPYLHYYYLISKKDSEIREVFDAFESRSKSQGC